MTQLRRSAPSASAQALGYGGLFPFVGLASVVCLWQTHHAAAANALLAYGAVIASFLGAIHWGLTMGDAKGQSTSMLLWGVVPSLLAWLAFLLPVAFGLSLLAALLWCCFAVDRITYTRFGLRAWLPKRLLLTAVASLSCLVSAARMLGVAL